MSRTIERYEHEAIAVGDPPAGIKVNELDALVRFNDATGRKFFVAGHRRITTTCYVGYVEVGPLAIEILPKADKHAGADRAFWKAGLLEMLRVVHGLRLESPTSAAQRVARTRLLDLVALGFVTEVEVLLREGLVKGYRDEEANGPRFRGRLKIAEHLRENVARADRFYVAFQTYDHDVACNQVLVAALDELARRALSPGVASRVAACRATFPDVRAAVDPLGVAKRLRLGRATHRYEQALVYARMILAQLGPQLRAGADRVFALLFDMEVLWERYVAALFRRAAPPGVIVSTQEHRDFWRPSGQTSRKVRPDIVVRRDGGDAPGKTLLVVDTKWKIPSSGPSVGDLMQMFVYNELLGAPRSLLLYPDTTGAPGVVGPYADRTHGCAQRSLGLAAGQEWSTRELEAQVAALLAQHAAS